MKNTDVLNNRLNVNHETVLEVNSEVVQMNQDIMQMNKDILEMNKTYTKEQQSKPKISSSYKSFKISNEIVKELKIDNSEKENREPKRENKVRKLIVKQDFQKDNIRKSCEQLEIHKEVKDQCFQVIDKAKTEEKTQTAE
eukprot:TRINITY_DN13909_c0_g1_i1.p1 TRINITY_DN13909_c0_g1~~TRINITY_DN13909_c0_g1_i1.p1  ORF type:complete len:140 (-),score=31.06 TRINITY_DN13909_c0_g1_i1:666-1085(-)